MVNLLGSNVVNRDFGPRSGQTKDYKIDICCLFAKLVSLRSKTGWLGIRIMCPREATYLSAVNSTRPVGLVQNRYHHHLIKIYLVLAMIQPENYSLDIKQQSFTQSNHEYT